ncbi:hypothetical protein PRIC2_005994 [Phytophthora ramorum]
MISASQYSLALLLVAAAASNGLSDAASLRQPQRGLAAMGMGDYHAAMLEAVNKQRATKGLASLCINKKLYAAAQRHSDDMAAKNYMEHDGSDGSTMSQRITDAGYEWDGVAENVAAGQEDVVSVMDSWIKSPGHLENIMGDYTMCGFAYSYNADSTYGYYWTQDFGSGSTEECDSDSTPQATPAATKQEPTPAPTTSAPETPFTKAPVVTPAATTPAPAATPAATTPGPVATPAATTPGPAATPAATTPGPVATPAATTPAPVATPAATTTPPSTSQKDCESNF